MSGGKIAAMVGALCLLLAVEPAGPLALPTRERADANVVRSSKSVPRPRVAPPPVTIKPATADHRGLAESLGLEPRLDGGYDYTGKNNERFDAIIARDGVVEFRVDPTVDLSIDGICAAAICAYRKPKKTRREQRRRQAAVTMVGLLAEAALGRVSTSAVTYGYPKNGPIAYRPFDLMPFNYAVVQGRYGHLPTPAASMQDFMDRTYDLRVELAMSAAVEDLAAERKRLPTRLIRLWTDETLPAAARREAILELWADLDRVGDHSDPVVAGDRRFDDRRREAIADARATILDFVRRHAREGTPEAFTADELDAFNDRPGAVRFDPYR